VTNTVAIPGPKELSDAESAAMFQALVLGVRDYARKCGFRSAVLGLSGGIDSALTAAIAAQALGREQVLGLAMPLRYSSPGSVSDAADLAHNLGIRYRELALDGVFQAYLDSLGPAIEGLGPAGTSDVTFENLQARIRGAAVMAASNRTGALALTTGNKSEIAVGYCTLYGDMAGGLAVIGDLLKTHVYSLARHFNRSSTPVEGSTVRGGGLIPLATLEKAPSAELRPNQTDQDSLPPYDLLDAILERLVEERLGADAVIAEGFPEREVRRVAGLVQRAEYKRRQGAPILIVTRKAFSIGRRMPVAQGFST
jgi:NAD+ synthase (glutamine-hydrolysing)